MRLARVGHETVTGFILMENYEGETKEIEQLTVENVSTLLASDLQFVDVRRSGEHVSGHAPGTVNLPLDKLKRSIEQLDPAKPTYVICQGGYRSSIATSILENAGFRELYNVTGGTAAWIERGLPVEGDATALVNN
jgi:rhodanese-related sulfurtransferase